MQSSSKPTSTPGGGFRPNALIIDQDEPMLLVFCRLQFGRAGYYEVAQKQLSSETASETIQSTTFWSWTGKPAIIPAQSSAGDGYAAAIEETVAPRS
jgi:hypothetical protein